MVGSSRVNSEHRLKGQFTWQEVKRERKFACSLRTTDCALLESFVESPARTNVVMIGEVAPSVGPVGQFSESRVRADSVTWVARQIAIRPRRVLISDLAEDFHEIPTDTKYALDRTRW